MNYIDWLYLHTKAVTQIGKPYLWGAKPAIDNPNPISFDCSGFVRWCYGQIGLILPEGSQEQFDTSNSIKLPQLGDVGFFRAEGQPTHHVGILISAIDVIEARGFEPSLEAQNIRSNCVLTRPREKWENFKEFTGWRRFKAVMV